MAVGAQGHLAHAAEQLAERWIARHVLAERELGEKEADQRLDFGPAAVGVERADDQLVLPRQAVEQGRGQRHQGHEAGRALAPGELAQALRLPRAEPQRDAAAAHRRLVHGPRPVLREVQEQREAAELLHPPVQVVLEHLAAHPVALPDREVGVLHGQRRQSRGPPLVERRQLLPEELEGDPVVDDVVHREHADVVALAHLHQGGPQQRSAFQVEGEVRVQIDEPQGLGLAGFGRQAGEVDQRQLQVELGRDALHRLAVHRGEGGAPGAMAADDAVERLPQPGPVERAAQPGRRDHVVGRALRVHEVEEPEPLLVVGERPVPHTRPITRPLDRRRLVDLRHRLLLLLLPQLLEEGLLLRSEGRDAVGNAHEDSLRARASSFWRRAASICLWARALDISSAAGALAGRPRCWARARMLG